MGDEAVIEEPEGEEPEGEEIEESEGEEPEGEEPEGEEAPDYSWAAELGSPDEVKDAVAFNRYIRTKEGASDYLVQAAVQLGASLEDVERLFGEQHEEEGEELDPERVMTWAEFQAEQEKSQQAQQQKETSQVIERVAQAIDTAWDELKIPVNQRALVLTLADDHLETPADQGNPAKVRAAIEAAYDELFEVMGVDKQAAVEKKAAANKKLPRPLKGKTPGGQAAVEPQSVKEAIERHRQQLRDEGVIE